MTRTVKVARKRSRQKKEYEEKIKLLIGRNFTLPPKADEDGLKMEKGYHDVIKDDPVR